LSARVSSGSALSFVGSSVISSAIVVLVCVAAIPIVIVREK
jgi:hypothetical protein